MAERELTVVKKAGKVGVSHKGVKVTKVAPGGAAEEAGVVVGMRILRINGREVTEQDAKQAFAEAPETFKLVVREPEAAPAAAPAAPEHSAPPQQQPQQQQQVSRLPSAGAKPQRRASDTIDRLADAVRQSAAAEAVTDAGPAPEQPPAPSRRSSGAERASSRRSSVAQSAAPPSAAIEKTPSRRSSAAQPHPPGAGSEALRAEHAAALHEAARLREQLAAAQQEAADLREQLAATASALREAAGLRKELAATVSSLRSTEDDAAKQAAHLRETKAELAAKGTELQEARGELEARELELGRLRQELSEREVRLSGPSAEEVTSLQAQLEEALRQLAGERELRAAAEHLAQEHGARAAEANVARDVAAAEFARREAELLAALASVDSGQAQERELAELKAEVERLRGATEQVRELRAELRRSQEQEELLRADLQRSQAAADELRGEVRSVGRELAVAEGDRRSLRERVAAAESAGRASAAEVSRLHEELRSAAFHQNEAAEKQVASEVAALVAELVSRKQAWADERTQLSDQLLLEREGRIAAQKACAEATAAAEGARERAQVETELRACLQRKLDATGAASLFRSASPPPPPPDDAAGTDVYEQLHVLRKQLAAERATCRQLKGRERRAREEANALLERLEELEGAAAARGASGQWGSPPRPSSERTPRREGGNPAPHSGSTLDWAVVHAVRGAVSDAQEVAAALRGEVYLLQKTR
eukprot:TRINITY_DN11094_c0_g1_i1.p1 TRINITY_DN11094_c0_g1~~TRINITY_DN11094_c0_g1_i1.p1  ORF type:complete len:741 (+),score=185.84 TRINITY_DN11094_c0_g1_i1:78-2225(+)